jgi:hypothetical protein
MDKFGSTYSELRNYSKASLMYHVLYMLRRLLITFIATILKQDPYLQVQLIVLHSVIMIIYITYVKPF